MNVKVNLYLDVAPVFFCGYRVVHDLRRVIHEWRIKENSNSSYSIQGLYDHIIQFNNALYWLNNVYDKEIKEAHQKGDFHIHDLGYLTGYCMGWDLEQLLVKGFGGVPGKITSRPPKHFAAALGQIWNFFYTLQGESAGAQAFSSFDTYLAPFVRHDNLTYEQVKQLMEEFIYNMNVPTRAGFQCMSEDTEILTPTGWKKHNEINEGDIICTFNTKTGKIEDLPVNHKFAREYSGNMYSIVNDDTDQMISPKHRMVIYSPNGFETILKTIEEVVYDGNDVSVPVMGEGNNMVKTIIRPSDIMEVKYKGIIWCPNTDNETVIAKRKGKVFVTGNTPFTNITLDLQCPVTLKGKPVIIGGVAQKETYDMFQNEMNMINRAFCEVMEKGDAVQKMFTFPIPTYNITNEFDWDNPEYEPIWRMTAKYGIPYFANFCGSDMKPTDVRSLCCRLRISQKELRRRGGGLFGANPMTGSIGVVTINLPRLGYLSKTKKEFYERLDNLMDLAARSLIKKREVIERNMEHDLYPYSKYYLGETKKRSGSYFYNHFNTIGLLGMNECCLNLFNKDITTTAGLEFAKEVLNHMRDRLVTYQETYKTPFNLEATPGESSMFRFAKHDSEKYKNIITAGSKEAPYYTNSTNIPAKSLGDIFDDFKHQEQLQSLYTGGCVFHIYAGDYVEDYESVKLLIKQLCNNFKVPYISFTPTFSICPEHGIIPGVHETCPYCTETESDQPEEA